MGFLSIKKVILFFLVWIFVFQANSTIIPNDFSGTLVFIESIQNSDTSAELQLVKYLNLIPGPKYFAFKNCSNSEEANIKYSFIIKHSVNFKYSFNDDYIKWNSDTSIFIGFYKNGISYHLIFNKELSDIQNDLNSVFGKNNLPIKFKVPIPDSIKTNSISWESRGSNLYGNDFQKGELYCYSLITKSIYKLKKNQLYWKIQRAGIQCGFVSKLNREDSIQIEDQFVLSSSDFMSFFSTRYQSSFVYVKCHVELPYYDKDEVLQYRGSTFILKLDSFLSNPEIFYVEAESLIPDHGIYYPGVVGSKNDFLVLNDSSFRLPLIKNFKELFLPSSLVFDGRYESKEAECLKYVPENLRFRGTKVFDNWSYEYNYTGFEYLNFCHDTLAVFNHFPFFYSFSKDQILFYNDPFHPVNNVFDSINHFFQTFSTNSFILNPVYSIGGLSFMWLKSYGKYEMLCVSEMGVVLARDKTQFKLGDFFINGKLYTLKKEIDGIVFSSIF